MNDEKLIECVRSYPALYNTGDPQYLDVRYKINVWRTIAQEFDLEDFNLCKSRWTNIRDQYRKNLKQMKADPKKIKKYKYAYLLDFLGYEDDDDKIDRSRNEDQSLHHLDNEESDSETSRDNQQFDVIVKPEQRLDNSCEEVKECNAANDPLKVPSGHSGQRKGGPTISVRKSKQRTRDKYNTTGEDIHPMDAFLRGLAPTLKTFSPKYQHIAKGQIFQIVHNLELQQL